MAHDIISYNQLREDEYSRWLSLLHTSPSEFISLWKHEIDEKLRVVLPFFKEKQELLKSYFIPNTSSYDFEEVIKNLQLEKYEEGLDQIKHIVSRFYNSCLLLSLDELLDKAKVISEKIVWQIKHIICCCYDLYRYKEQLRIKRLNSISEQFKFDFSSFPQIPYFTYTDSTVAINFLETIKGDISKDEIIVYWTYLLCINDTVFSDDAFIQYLKDRFGPFEIDSLITEILWKVILEGHPDDDIFNSIVTKYKVEKSYLASILKNKHYKDERKKIIKTAHLLQDEIIKYIIIWYLRDLNLSSIFRILYVTTKLKKHTTYEAFAKALIMLFSIKASILKTNEFKQWLLTALRESDKKEVINNLSLLVQNQYELKEILTLFDFPLSSNVSIFQDKSHFIESFIPQVISLTPLKIDTGFYHINPTFIQWLKVENIRSTKGTNETSISNEGNNTITREDNTYITKVSADQLQICNGYIKYQDYYLFSNRIRYVDTATFFSPQKEFVIVKDDLADKKNNKKNFKFYPESDLENIIKVCEYIAFNSPSLNETILASNVSADNFKIEDGYIKYHDYILKSVRIKKIKKNILERITHVFTLKKDFDKKDRNAKKFIFVPATDLSLLLAEADRIRDELSKSTGKTTSASHYPETGTFDLPWKNVIFYDGVMYLTHPNPSVRATTTPYHYIHQSLKKSFRDIMPYIETRCEKFKVSCKDSVITEVHNFDAFKSQIPQLLDYFTRQETEVDIDKRNRYAIKPISSSIFRELKWVKKSPYLNFLSQKQIKEFKIYYIVETRIHSANSGEDEFGYLFTVNSNSQFAILIYENVADESRSSIVFYVKPNSVLNAIEHIRRFFGSDIENKRQMLANKMIRFPSEVFHLYSRINHTDFNEWKRKLSDLTK